MERYIREFQVTVILTTVTTMCKIAERLMDANMTAPYVRLLLFSGEAFYDDQAGLLRAAFPKAAVRSVVYGSMDCGVIGLPPKLNDCIYIEDPRVHQVNSPNMVIEIVTEDGQVTTKPGVAGSLIATNMERRLMPIIRYPSGDRAVWVDYDLGLFRIQDRDRTAIRIGPVSVDFVDLRRVVVSALRDRTVGPIQAVVSREDRKDKLTLVVVFQPGNMEETRELEDAIRKGLNSSRPMLLDHVEKELINPLEIRFVGMQGLTVNPRTGKAVEASDLRSTEVP